MRLASIPTRLSCYPIQAHPPPLPQSHSPLAIHHGVQPLLRLAQIAIVRLNLRVQGPPLAHIPVVEGGDGGIGKKQSKSSSSFGSNEVEHAVGLAQEQVKGM
jgi:hypothetical protein